MAAPTLETNAGATILRITDGTSGDPVTWDDVWNFDAGSGAGLVPKDGGGTARVDTFMTKIVTNAIYTVQKDIKFGNDTDASYFASENEMIYFDDDFVYEVKGNATLRKGDIEDGFGIKGSTWSIGPALTTNLVNHADATLLMYASELHLRTSQGVLFQLGAFTFINVTLSGRYPDVGANNFFVIPSGTLTIKDVFVSRMASFSIATPTSTIDNLQIHNTDGLAMEATSVDFTIENVSFTGVDEIQLVLSNAIIDNLTGTVTPIIFVSGSLTLRYPFNVHVTDKDGGDLPNVTVDCKYAHLVKGSDGKTYKCSTDFTATNDEFKPIDGSGDWASKWDLYDAGGGLGGDWNNDSFDYKADEEEFAQQTTGGEGDISEQVIQYKKWVGTSGLLEARIHKFTYTHTAYPDSVINNIIVDHPLIWEFDMGQDIAAIISATETAINNQIALTGGKIDGVALVDVTTENTDMRGTEGANTGDVILANSADHGGVDAVFTLKWVNIRNTTGNALDIVAVGSGTTGVNIEGQQLGLNIDGGIGGGISAAEIDAILPKLLKYVQLMTRNDDAIQQANATELTAINASGGEYNNGLAALEALRHRGDIAWNTGVGVVASESYAIDSAEIIVGDEDAGDSSKINIVDGDYWSIGETNAGTYLEVDLVFVANDDKELPVAVVFWIQYDGGGNHHLDVLAHDHISDTDETIGEIAKTDGIVMVSFTLLPNHIEAGTKRIEIKLLHGGGNGIPAHVVHIDKVIATTATTALLQALIEADKKVVLNDGKYELHWLEKGTDTILQKKAMNLIGGDAITETKSTVGQLINKE